MNNTPMIEQTPIETLIELGAKAPQVFNALIPGAVPLVALPKNQELHSLEEFLPPARISRHVNLCEATSFCDYINRFKTDKTMIFAAIDGQGVTFHAILDYHEPAPSLAPAYCQHHAFFTASHTPEWQIWCEYNRKSMNQVAFATFIEDNLPLFREPTGATLLDLVRSLHGHKNARFNSALRLDNGAWSVEYDEDIVVKGNSTAKNGGFELPPVIKAGMSVFLGAAAYEVPARLKVRLEDRKLILWYETINLPQIVRESVLLLVKQVITSTKITVLLGKP